MKDVVLIFIVALSICYKVKAQNLVDLLPGEIDLGEVQTKTVHDVYFLFENVYTDSIVITNVQPSWGGIVAEFPDYPIGAGDIDTIFLQMFDNEGGVRVKNTSIAIYNYPDQNVFEQEIFTLKWIGVDSIMTSIDGEIPTRNVIVSPNPVSDKMKIIHSGLETDVCIIKVYNLSGICVLKKYGYRFGDDIDIPSEMRDGLYVVSIVLNDTTVSAKIIRNRR
ncbi:MAG: DUF1573 domain-containing protein [Saprospiraceae bacterium]|nr:DUF1573 domain-containing protein [Saprospiraceae bacterium]